MKKVNQEIFLEKAFSLYGNRYDYSKSLYVNSSSKILIKCNICKNEFYQSPNAHLQNNECLKCSRVKQSLSRRKPFSYYLEKFKITHKGFYNYEESSFTGSCNKMIMICPLHGTFKLEPIKHVNGVTCKLCYFHRKRNIHTIESFKELAIKIHKDLYDYQDFEYKGATEKSKIKCNNCKKVFLQSPSKHLIDKYGCRNCSFYLSSFKKNNWIIKSKGRVGKFYILKFFNSDENFIKVGITFKSIKERYQGLKNYKYEIFKEIKSSDLSKIWDMEKEFIRKNKEYHYIPLFYFAGSKKECFKEDSILNSYPLDKIK